MDSSTTVTMKPMWADHRQGKGQLFAVLHPKRLQSSSRDSEV